MHENKIVSHIEKLLLAKSVIGVSATYRGNNGLDKIISVLCNSYFIQPTSQLKERELELKVFGKFSQDNVISQVVELAK